MVTAAETRAKVPIMRPISARSRRPTRVSVGIDRISFRASVGVRIGVLPLM
jgi:hypothetical protein